MVQDPPPQPVGAPTGVALGGGISTGPMQPPPAQPPPAQSLPPTGSGSNPIAQEVTVTVACGACQKQVMVSASTGMCQFSCPNCGARNQFSLGPPAQEAADMQVFYPSYWQIKDEGGRAAAAAGGPAPYFGHDTEEVKVAVQALLTKTWKNQWTRDRGKDKKISQFEVVSVQRNENPAIWEKYYKIREFIANKLAEQNIELWDPEPKTQALTKDVPEAEAFFSRAKLRKEVNEFYLFHGTNPTAAKLICDNDFNVKKAGSNAGTLYGPGVYLAEASSKADEYASDEQGIFQGHYGMLVCRVVCGNIRYTDEVSPPVQDLVDSVLSRRTHHSVLGDREKCRGTYREFIVFDQAQIYPEYVAIYKRVEKK